MNHTPDEVVYFGLCLLLGDDIRGPKGGGMTAGSAVEGSGGGGEGYFATARDWDWNSGVARAQSARRGWLEGIALSA